MTVFMIRGAEIQIYLKNIFRPVGKQSTYERSLYECRRLSKYLRSDLKAAFLFAGYTPCGAAWLVAFTI